MARKNCDAKPAVSVRVRESYCHCAHAVGMRNVASVLAASSFGDGWSKWGGKGEGRNFEFGFHTLTCKFCKCSK